MSIHILASGLHAIDRRRAPVYRVLMQGDITGLFPLRSSGDETPRNTVCNHPRIQRISFIRESQPKRDGGDMGADDNEEMTVVSLPGAEDEAERQRIRSSNDRDQEKERDGKPARHNRGYDEVAKG